MAHSSVHSGEHPALPARLHQRAVQAFVLRWTVPDARHGGDDGDSGWMPTPLLLPEPAEGQAGTLPVVLPPRVCQSHRSCDALHVGVPVPDVMMGHLPQPHWDGCGVAPSPLQLAAQQWHLPPVGLVPGSVPGPGFVPGRDCDGGVASDLPAPDPPCAHPAKVQSVRPALPQLPAQSLWQRGLAQT